MYELTYRFAAVSPGEPAGEHLPVVITPYSHPIGYPWWSASTRAVLGMLPELIDPGDRVLDFGCGPAAILAVAAARLRATVVALEAHPELAAIARQQIEANGLDIPVIEADDGLPYDVILANIGDAVLVGTLSTRSPRGVGSDSEDGLIVWRD